VDAHRRLGERQNLESILSHVEQRKITNDYTVSWEGKFYRVPPAAVRRGLRMAWVRVEGRLNGTVWVRIGDQLCRRFTPNPYNRRLSYDPRRQCAEITTGAVKAIG